jgi:hypothetical protein
MILTQIFAFLTLALPFQALAELSHRESVELSPSTHFAHTSPLTVVLLKNSSWTTAEAVQKIRRTEQIYAQCRVSFSPITLISLNQSLGSTMDIDHAEDYFANTGPLSFPRPVVWLYDREKNNTNEGGFSMRFGAVGLGSPLLDQAVLFRSYALAPEREYPISSPMLEGHYEVMAHELGHVLFDEPHLIQDGNLMSVVRTRTNLIEPWQCSLIGKPHIPGRSVPAF